MDEFRLSNLRTAMGFLALVGSLSGCAGSTATDTVRTTPEEFANHSHIVVFPFAATADDVKLNSGFFETTYRDFTGEDETA